MRRGQAVGAGRGAARGAARGAVRTLVLASAIVVGAVAPFVAVALLPTRSTALSWALALSALVYTVGLPVLVVVVVRTVLRDARDARASVEVLGAELGWERAARGARVAFVGVHRGRSAYVVSTVRMDPTNDGGRKRFRAWPVVRVGFDEAPLPGGPEGVDLQPRGVTVDDVRLALDTLVGTAPDRSDGGPERDAGR